MRRSRLIVSSTVVLAIAVVSAASVGSVTRHREAAAAQRHLLTIRNRQLELERLLSVMRDAETGQRGFLLTRRPDYLEPYAIASSETKERMARISTAFADDPELAPALRELETAIEAKQTELDRTVGLARDGAFEQAIEMVGTDRGRVAMDRIRDLVAAMQSTEDRRASQAAASVATAQAIAVQSIGALTALSLLMIGVLLYVMRRAANQVRASEERLAITLSSIGDGVIATDGAMRVTLLNPVAERLTGWPSSAAKGQAVQTVFQIVNEYTRASVPNPIERVLREGVVVGLANHTVLIARDGTETPIEDSAAPIRDRDGEIQGVVLVFRDASEARAAERTLLDADRRKNEFLAVLAHELRNPLAPIRQAATIASSKQASEAQVSWSHEVIERQVGHMARLLDDLLDVSRITRGTLEIRRARVSVAAVIDEAAEMAKPVIDARGHALAIELPPEALWLDADPLRLAQVIANLLTNAAKFTPSGGRIDVRAERSGAHVRIDVSDDGIGLTREALDQIFGMFVQLDAGFERTEGGLGIGLALAKGLVELHGGRIHAASGGLGQGTTITIELPLAVADRAASMPAGPASEERFAKATVVIADDNRDAADSLAMLLRLQGHEVAIAHDGATALDELERLRPMIALIDIGMPEKNGYEVARAVRASAWGAEVHLVALTGWGQAADRERAFEAGFDEHWVKPVDPGSVATFCTRVAVEGAAQARRTGSPTD